uniref:Uncharacterized protein n=1 Tax=Ananas comosus var. bracteatus TaxID=296719 RepID=A0A6V7PAI3_ANACO|nr:unnamed protein product [Ananas comosus var. bracteatus]
MEMGGVGNDDHSSGGGGGGGGDGREHVVMFPFMAKGHTVPVIHLAGALSRRGLRVTILTTPANAPFLRRSLPRRRVSLLSLPFPSHPRLPPASSPPTTSPPIPPTSTPPSSAPPRSSAPRSAASYSNSSPTPPPPPLARSASSPTSYSPGFYRGGGGGGGGGARAWLVGPMSLLAARVNAEEEEDPDHDPEGCLAWLDEHRPGEAVYVAFGTQAHVADAQLDEAAHGLVGSGHPFLWAVRSETWAPPAPLAAQIQSRGKIVRGWAPQNAILGHVAVGGFVTHCGWNSVLESLSAGKPMLAWPMIAEQVLNAKHLAEILGAG